MQSQYTGLGVGQEMPSLPGEGLREKNVCCMGELCVVELGFASLNNRSGSVPEQFPTNDAW